MKAALLLGSNQGSRARHLARARTGLARLPASRLVRCSRIYESPPLGPSKRPFLNQAVLLETRLRPLGLLAELKRLEARAGRRPAPRWSARPLDIDILLMGGLRLRSRLLAIPHPGLKARAFALAPLSELIPSWAPALKRLNAGAGTVKIYSPR